MFVSSLVPSFAEAQLAPRGELTESLDAEVHVAPMSAVIGGRNLLAYELFLTNTRSDSVRLLRIRVVDEHRNGAPLAELADTTLLRAVQPLARGPSRDSAIVLAPGVRRVVYVWLALDASRAVPRRLRNVIDFTTGTGQALTFTMPYVAIDTREGVTIAPPLRGGEWLALYDPWLIGGHRMSFYTTEGRARIPARFAIDFVRLPSTRRYDPTAKGLQRNGYGSEVLAVADGVIAAAVDDMPDTDDSAPRVRFALSQGSGNHIVLSLGNGRYAFYEHLAPRSVRVRPGQRVRAGDVLAKLGASGSTSIGAHLHFHLADHNAALGAEGIPFSFRSFVERGTYSNIIEALSGSEWSPTSGDARGGGRARTREMPSPNSVLVFP